MRLIPLLLFILASMVPAGLASQEPRTGCRDAHQWPTCKSYFLFELVGTVRESATRASRPGCVPAGSDYCARQLHSGYIAWDAGWMVSHDSTYARGASLQIGGGDGGLRVALRARHRQWLTPRFVADVAVGPLMMQTSGTTSADGIQETYGVTGEVGAGLARIGLVTLGADAVRLSRQTSAAAHVGLKLESGAAAVATGFLTAVALAVYAALSSGGY